MKKRNYTLVLLALVLGFSSCEKDDETFVTTPPRDRAEVYAEDIVSIETYLSTHFYNYEEFEADPTSTTFEIEFDTIEGTNMDKTPLIDQVDFKMVTDAADIEYKLYYLKVREGGGQQPTFADSTYVTYRGTLETGDVFDEASNPVWFSLPFLVQGFREATAEFKGATGYTENGDGTLTYNDFGIGAMFIPSGLGYFNNGPLGIQPYTPLIFTIHLLEVNKSDEDRDGVPNILEDLDGNRNLITEDTDGDFIPDFQDIDDDGDGTLTRDEVVKNTYVVDTNVGEIEPTLGENEYEADRKENAGVITIYTVTLTDSNNDGTPDYLDATIE